MSGLVVTYSTRHARPDAAERAGNGRSVRPRRAAPQWRYSSALVRERIEVVPAQPTLHLRARLAHRLGDRGDVPAVLLEQGDDLLAARAVVGGELHFRQTAGRRRHLHGRREVLRLDDAFLGEDGRAGEAFLQLSDVARPGVTEHRPTGFRGERELVGADAAQQPRNEQA